MALSFGGTSAWGVVQRLYGVKFGQTQIWQLLGTLGFSAQTPAQRAIERNEDTVHSWKRSTFPALKEKRSEKAV